MPKYLIGVEQIIEAKDVEDAIVQFNELLREGLLYADHDDVDEMASQLLMKGGAFLWKS